MDEERVNSKSAKIKIIWNIPRRGKNVKDKKRKVI